MSRIILLVIAFCIGDIGLSGIKLSAAKRVINKINYLPFDSKSDGCFARALYMGMELTSAGIASSNQYFFGNLKPSRSINWNYHVAPMVEVGGAAGFAIFDPSLSKQPVTRRKWFQLNRPKGRSEAYVTPITYYKKKGVQTMSQKGRPGFTMRSRIRSLSQLPRFRIDHIANACKTAWVHIGKEKLSKRKVYRKRRRLVERTRYLVKSLKSLGKVSSAVRLSSCSRGTYYR